MLNNTLSAPLSATLTLDNDFELSPVDPRLFGGLAEHLGRHIYTGIYEPTHPTATAEGFRGDVIALVRELDISVVRYPGGNFVSNYDWENGVGPLSERPARLDLAWHTTEPNTFGTNEFAGWCRAVGAAPMIAVNLGTRGAADAQRLVEYCNHPRGTRYSDLRRSHGVSEPHGIKLWCLGNEMDGDWQTGHKEAHEYGRVAAEASKMMKWTDPGIETVLCGSSSAEMKTFGRWEWDALHAASAHVDYLSLHQYFGNRERDTPRFLADPDRMSAFIEQTTALCDAVCAAKKQKRKIHLSFDEWNVWYHADAPLPDKYESWQVAPPILEDHYTMEDALVVGGCLITLLNHCDRVKIACLAQIVNVIAPILTVPGGGAWRQTIFYPFAQASALGRGTVLRVGGTLPERDGRKTLAVAAVRSEQGDRLTLFAVNRELTDTTPLSVNLRGFGAARVLRHTVLRHDDLTSVNTEAAPNTVVPSAGGGAKVEGEVLTVRLAPASWNVIEVGLRG